MKQLTALLFFGLLSLPVFAQTEAETIKKAKDLIAGKKYESAFKLLDGFDPRNGRPDVVLLKEEILLNYFVTSIMHQMFALKDLEKNEDIMDYRGKEGSFGMQMFDPERILDSLIRIYPDNCKLYKGLGDYYFDAHLRYGDNWLKSGEELFKLMEINDKKALEGKCGDFMTYYVMGYVNLVREKYRESMPFFLKSIELNKEYPSSFYNLAYAYMLADEPENALKYAKISLDLYDDQTYKSDAARMMGGIYWDLENYPDAISQYELADKIDPGNYYNLKPLLELYIRTGNPKAAETTAMFFNLAPEKNSVYNDLAEVYRNNKKEAELAAFFTEQIKAYEGESKILGNLHFYTGKIYLGSDKKLAREHFLQAKEMFGKVYEKDHQVFKVIEDALKKTEK